MRFHDQSKGNRITVALRRLKNVDLRRVKMKLCDSAEGCGWSLAKADLVEQEYRRFLALSLAYPDSSIVPDREVDAFWHQHILDTRAYQRDSVMVFGHFLHHFPYFGLDGPEDAKRLVDSYRESQDLYLKHFGQRVLTVEAGASGCSSSTCTASNCSSCTSSDEVIGHVSVQ